MREHQGMATNPWTWAIGAGAWIVVGLAGCGGDGPAAESGANRQASATDPAGGRSLPTLEIPTQPVATSLPQARPIDTAAELVPPDSPPPLADGPAGRSLPSARDRFDNTVESTQKSARDLRNRVETGAEELQEKADQTINRTQKRIQSTADDLSRKVDGAVGEVGRQTDRLQKQADSLQKKAGDLQKKAGDVRDGVEQTGKAIRNLIGGGGEGSRPRN